ncbi:hypothetical protein K525DRAFT_266670 [Schizophyllum commune Loenen D]|nr:hypothetical protein K525DRAFT_266670 [Schizophyllum commune Loenen D]
MSSCTSETAAASSAENGPDVAPSVLGAAGREGEVDLIDLHSRLSPVPEGEPDEVRSTSPSLSAPPNATTTQITLEPSWEDPNLSDRLPEEVLSTSVAPFLARLTDEDRAALTSYLAQADDDRDHNEFLATLPLARNSDLNPRLAINGGRGVDQAESGLSEISCARPSTPSRELGAIKGKGSFLPNASQSTSGTLEAPLRLSTSSAITSDGMLHFVFSASDEAQSKSIEEALAAFEASLAQDMTVQHLYLVLAPGVPLPANFLARAIEKAHVSLTRFTRLTVHLQTAAAQAQAPWAWHLSSRLIDVQLNGIARGAVLPWAQLQVLRISAEVKAVETAALLVNLPQLRALSLCLGYVGSKKVKYKRSKLPRLERLELESKIDPAVFLNRVRLPALRVLGLHLDIASQVGGDKLDYGKRLLKCKILWNALHDVQLSGPSAGPTTLFFLRRLFDDDGPAVQTQCRLSRGK